MPTQNVNLTPELNEFVKKKVESGDFNNASEVHRAALVTMRKQEEERQARIAFLRGEIQNGIDDINDGNFTEIEGSDDLQDLMEQCAEAALQKSKSDG